MLICALFSPRNQIRQTPFTVLRISRYLARIRIQDKWIALAEKFNGRAFDHNCATDLQST